jgi:plastocyanin
MEGLSQSFERLEGHLALGDSSGIVGASTDMQAFAAHLDRVRPELNAEFLDVFSQHAARVGELVSELAELARNERIGAAAQAFEELRATCVTCHLQFRSNNVERGNYPSRENTVVGTVELRDVEGGGREDRSWVLVFLEGGPPRTFANARDNPRISQRDRRFHPRVLPVLTGTEVEFPNDDTIFHNVFSLSKNVPFDLGVYQPGESASVLMARTGLVRVYCNIHPEMAASIVVLNNPWFALTDRGGRFVLCSVPDGEYALRAWNDLGAEAREPIVLSGGAVLEKRIVLQETRRTISHSNKYGNPYPSKYR